MYGHSSCMDSSVIQIKLKNMLKCTHEFVLGISWSCDFMILWLNQDYSLDGPWLCCILISDINYG